MKNSLKYNTVEFACNNRLECLLPIYHTNAESTTYNITVIHDMHLNQCLCTIRDVQDDRECDVRLLTKWITTKDRKVSTFIGDVGEGVQLPKLVIDMLDINFFENFH